MAEQPLFPLRTVLFPDGLLELKIFEARYLDLMSRCLREQRPSASSPCAPAARRAAPRASRCSSTRSARSPS